MNNPEVKNSELSIEESLQLAANLASPREKMTLEFILAGSQPVEGGIKSEYQQNQQHLSGVAIRCVPRAADAEVVEAVLDVEKEVLDAEEAVNYVLQIGVLNADNRRMATENMSRDDFTLAA